MELLCATNSPNANLDDRLPLGVSLANVAQRISDLA